MEFIKLKGGNVIATTEKHEHDDVVKTMKLKFEDVGFEKHVPFIEKINGIIHARTGKDIMHPATEEHYMDWFKLVINNEIIETIKLGHTDNPSVIFKTAVEDNQNCDVYVYCNLHGVWKGSI